MNTFFLHDGRNELGPFTLDELKKQKLTRSTPLRITNTDAWLPAEKVDGLRPLLRPKKIKTVKDVVPVVKQHVADLRQRKPVVLYGALLCLALLTGFSIYSFTRPTQQASLSVGQQPSGQAASLPTQAAAAPQTAAPAAEAKPLAESAAADPAKAVRQQWRKLITVTNSNYGIGLLGGIKDLSVIVSNRTDYVLDEVVAKVVYLKAGGGVWKTKLVALQAVPAHDTKELALPDVGRGKKVKISLHKVASKAMKLRYTSGEKVVEGETE